MFLHKNEICPRGNWVAIAELVCGRWCNYINYQSSKSGREHTHEVICLKSCSPAVFVWQGDIPTLQEFIARGKGGGWMHTMLGKHKTHTHRDSDLLIDLYAFHSSSQTLVIMVITIIAIVVINHRVKGVFQAGASAIWMATAFFGPLEFDWLDWFDWGHIPTIIQGLTRCNQSVD